jgi:hypothetical protein
VLQADKMPVCDNMRLLTASELQVAIIIVSDRADRRPTDDMPAHDASCSLRGRSLSPSSAATNVRKWALAVVLPIASTNVAMWWKADIRNYGRFLSGSHTGG